MKNLYKFISAGVLAATAVSCADLDTQYFGTYVTDEQKQSVVEQNPSMATAAVMSIASAFNSCQTVADFNDGYHWDFGYASMMMGLDSQTADLLAKIPYTSSHIYWFGYVNPSPQGIPTTVAWTYMYDQIKVDNALLTSITKEIAASGDARQKFFRAQGLAVRAFNYWVLAQLYQFNYVGHENDKCVPLITEDNQDAIASDGAPRATVQQVYDQILEDINEAVALLKEANINPSSVMSEKPKRMISLAAAYGLRARIYLTMHKYGEAAADAQSAIDAFSGRPYTRQEVSVPAFTNSEDPSWMWAIVTGSTERPVTSGICNWPSQMGPFNDGYCNSSGWRWCNKLLFESIPSSDVRKGWFLDENYTSPNLSTAEQEYLDQYVPSSGTANYVASSSDIMPYTQVKYGVAGGGLGGYTTGYEVPMMRIEEMYLILAEGQAMSGQATAGLKTLNDFVSQNRDPRYKFTSADPAELQEEIYQQRRLELWGEGLAFFDVMRLNKGVNRVGGASMDDYNYNIEPNDPVLIYCIPLDEVTANPQISASDNNPTAPRPTPIIQ